MTVQSVSPIVAGDLVVPSAHTPMDKFFFDNRFLSLANAINGLIAQNAEFAQTENTLVAEALVRLNTAWGPLLTQLENAVEVGYLVAQSVMVPPSGGVSLQADSDVGWILTSARQYQWTVGVPADHLLAGDG